jgi:hypothetical protein
MKVSIQKATWYQEQLSPESVEAIELLSGVWREACSHFAVATATKLAKGMKGPMGIQQFLNDVIDERFLSSGWEGKNAKFRKNDTWVSISFRHQMSLGSDLYNALWLWKRGNVKQILLLAGTLDFLRIVTPLDATSLASFERFAAAMSQMTGAFEPPMIVGALEPDSRLDKKVAELVFGKRLKSN